VKTSFRGPTPARRGYPNSQDEPAPRSPEKSRARQAGRQGGGALSGASDRAGPRGDHSRETARHLAAAGDPHRRFALLGNEGRGDGRGKARILAAGRGGVRACGAPDPVDERIRTYGGARPGSTAFSGEGDGL